MRQFVGHPFKELVGVAEKLLEGLGWVGQQGALEFGEVESGVGPV
jgi:hypothetical protein